MCLLRVLSAEGFAQPGDRPALRDLDRAGALAKLIGKSRQFVQQMGGADRPIPIDVGKLLPSAISAAEAQEKKAFCIAKKNLREESHAAPSKTQLYVAQDRARRGRPS